ncbi:methylmalonyl-CoA mutase subunit beta [Flagellimonas beolgyonensis]|uniref:methylmalonyl-CoA mutase subunit beta n=1 Tax=Flagellimonas beolgyonensis TaxID=864064 RepID=UPI003D64B6A0
MSNTGLFEHFPNISAKQWKQQIQYDLKGADYNEALVWESLEGIKVKPFYNGEDLKTALPTTSAGHSWKIAQSLFCGDAQKANAKAKDILQKGVESLLLVIPNESIDFSVLLHEIDLAKVPLHFQFQFLAIEPIQKLLAFTKEKQAKIYINIDLIGHLAQEGNWYHNLEEDHRILADIFQLANSHGVESAVSVDLALYENAGANKVQQLAYAVAHANEYLNHFATSGAIEKSFNITFKAAVGSNYFFEIAKLKALRWLWKSLTPAYDLKHDCHIWAMPSKRNKTLYDYNVNMLRTTSECMSAVLGGADTVCNLPYDAIYHKDNAFGERIARNQLLLLKEEAYFEAASQISEGAYYIESLTQQLAEKALDLFKQIEASGGFLAALKKGTIQQKIKESALKEQELFDTGKIIALGTNKYPNSQDRMKDDLELYPFVKTQPRKTLVEPIIEKRLAEASEQKRLNDE